MNIKIHFNKISPKHNDSFWYDGLIAETNNFKVVAMGDIDIRKKNSDFSCNGFKTYDEDNQKDCDLCNIDKSNDETLSKLESNSYIWENNNWFEIIDKKTGEEVGIEHGYNEAIKILKEAK